MINKIYTPTKAERIDLMKKFIKKNPSITWVDLKRAVQTKDYPDNRFNSDIASLSLLLKREGFYLKIEPKIGKRKKGQNRYSIEARNQVPLVLREFKKKEATKEFEQAFKKIVEPKKNFGRLLMPKYHIGDTCYVIYDRVIYKNYIAGIMPKTTSKTENINLTDLIEEYRYLITPSPESCESGYLDWMPETFKKDGYREILNMEATYMLKEDELFESKEALINYINSLP